MVLGFHGTERKLVDDLLVSKAQGLRASNGKYEWLGHGIYFWENDPQRGLEWAQDGNAKSRIHEPDVVGVVLDLGLCLDLSTRSGIDEVAQAYEILRSSYQALGKNLPLNSGNADRFKRELDCQVVQTLHAYRKHCGQPFYDSVRAPFREDGELYPGAGFHRRSHSQIAVVNPNCIKGYFRPIRKPR